MSKMSCTLGPAQSVAVVVVAVVVVVVVVVVVASEPLPRVIQNSA